MSSHSVVGRVWRAALVAGLTLGALPAAPALAATIGQADGDSNGQCIATEVMTDTTYVANSAGTITSFSFENVQAANAGKQLDFLVLRPSTPATDSYTVVGKTGLVDLPAKTGVVTFPASISVQSGDIIGFWFQANEGAPLWGCLRRTNGSGGFKDTQFGTTPPDPGVGDTVSLPHSVASFSLNLSANLNPPGFFSNSTPITINDGGTCGNSHAASPYPSEIAVFGLTGSVLEVNATLDGLTHTFPDDVGVLLVGPGGEKTLLMADTGSAFGVSDIDLSFDDGAAASLPDNALIEPGTYRPTHGTAEFPGCVAPASFPGVAPAGPYDASLSVFNGTNPNGTWLLYVIDDSIVDGGSIAGGWSLDIKVEQDTDGVADVDDNCPTVSNPDQADVDGDGDGDACDDDDDGDGVPDTGDNCPSASNAGQADLDGDGVGDACDSDDDGDGAPDAADNCRAVSNPAQADLDADGAGDACDGDDDGDGVADESDNCGSVANAGQQDLDGDGAGDACDGDRDGDGAPDAADNCAAAANGDQRDIDGDAAGDVCDMDDDNDRLSDVAERALGTSSADLDSDDDGLADGREDRNRDGKRGRRETSAKRFDTDRDGLSDGLERGLRRGVADPPGPVKGTGRRFRRDRDPRTKTNPLRRDSDHGGVPDGKEDPNHNGRLDKGETNPTKPGNG